jgi:hypothetical protein
MLRPWRSAIAKRILIGRLSMRSGKPTCEHSDDEARRFKRGRTRSPADRSRSIFFGAHGLKKRMYEGGAGKGPPVCNQCGPKVLIVRRDVRLLTDTASASPTAFESLCRANSRCPQLCRGTDPRGTAQYESEPERRDQARNVGLCVRGSERPCAQERTTGSARNGLGPRELYMFSSDPCLLSGRETRCPA